MHILHTHVYHIIPVIARKATNDPLSTFRKPDEKNAISEKNNSIKAEYSDVKKPQNPHTMCVRTLDNK